VYIPEPDDRQVFANAAGSFRLLIAADACTGTLYVTDLLSA
jgi:hypothetical protein